MSEETYSSGEGIQYQMKVQRLQVEGGETLLGQDEVSVGHAWRCPSGSWTLEEQRVQCRLESPLVCR